MKKHLLPLLCCLLACMSCLKESTFSFTNYKDFVISHDNVLTSDEGYALNIVENSTNSDAWKTPGRYYITCDILNRNMDIRLKELNPVTVKQGIPYSEMEEPDDPIKVSESGFGGGYLNLIVEYYYRPDSDFAHQLDFYWEGKGREVYIYLFHKGNGENPSKMEESALKTKSEILSLPLEPIYSSGEYYVTNIVIYELDDKEVKRNSYRLSGSPL